jgi:hypothetical protein
MVVHSCNPSTWKLEAEGIISYIVRLSLKISVLLIRNINYIYYKELQLFIFYGTNLPLGISAEEINY